MKFIYLWYWSETVFEENSPVVQLTVFQISGAGAAVETDYVFEMFCKNVLSAVESNQSLWTETALLWKPCRVLMLLWAETHSQGAEYWVISSPCGFGLDQTAAADWSGADIFRMSSKPWLLLLLSAPPRSLGVSHWGGRLERHMFLPLKAALTLIHTSWDLSLLHFPSQRHLAHNVCGCLWLHVTVVSSVSLPFILFELTLEGTESFSMNLLNFLSS